MIWSKDQDRFMLLAAGGDNVSLSGKAGTGKSRIVRELIARSPNDTAVLAPTGIAAYNIGGQTVHSFFSIPPLGILANPTSVRKEKRVLWDSINRIIIDEVSMLRCDMLDVIEANLHKNGCKSLTTKQLIFVGDMKQLPVVMTDSDKQLFGGIYDRFDYTGSMIYPDLGVVDIELQQIFRQQDPEFITELNNIREGIPTKYFAQFKGKTPKGLILCPTKRLAEYHNKAKLDALTTPYHTFKAKIHGDVNVDSFPAHPELHLKDGCEVMHIINNGNLHNGSLGKLVIKNQNTLFFVANDTGFSHRLSLNAFENKKYVKDTKTKQIKMEIAGTMWQYPIIPAYAITIHKSQGLTLPEVVIDTTERMFLKEQFYTALTRVTSPEGLSII